MKKIGRRRKGGLEEGEGERAPHPPKPSIPARSLSGAQTPHLCKLHEASPKPSYQF
jgi:hypothetical protein